MDLHSALWVIAALFVVVGLSEPAAARLRLPYTVALAAVGAGLGAAAAFLWQTTLTDALNPLARAILDFPVSSTVLLSALLPALLFQAALSVDARRMLDDWVPILVLAVLAVVVATLTIGLALVPVSGLPVMACLLIAAIVSTTDPSVVVGLFRQLPAPRRLARILEGESLLNDAAAIALFGLFLGFLTIGRPDPDLAAELLRFPWLLLGGVVFGAATGRGALALMALLPRHPPAQVTISLALPLLVHLAAEALAGVSGVVAVVAAGLAVNLGAPGRLSPQTLVKLRETWELLAHWAGSFIFILAAIFVPRFLSRAEWSDLVLVAVTAAAALVARALILYLVLPALAASGLSPRVEGSYRLAILWGGLRGAVTLALALAVTESPYIAPEVKRQVGIVAAGFTFFTLIVQGLSLRPLIRRLGLDRLTPLDEALGAQVVATALQSVRDRVGEAAQSFGIDRGILSAETAALTERLDQALLIADEGTEIPDRDRITLGLLALAAEERNLVLELFRRQVIAPELAERLVGLADQLSEGARAGGRTGYLAAARRPLGGGRLVRLAEALHNRLGMSRPLAWLAERRFELLVIETVILHGLAVFLDRRIRPVHGPRVAGILHELLERRAEALANALDELRRQFPGYAEELERRLVRRTALQIEAAEYEALVADGLIGEDLRATLMEELDRRRDALAARPRLDLARQKAGLVRRFELFEGMDETDCATLARALRTVYARPGQVLMRRDQPAREVWFVASGAVTADGVGGRVRIGPGGMFGHLALLSGGRTIVEVTAEEPSTLLVLDEAGFRPLLRENARLRQRVAEAARRRGVALEPWLMEEAPPQPDAARAGGPEAEGGGSASADPGARATSGSARRG
jgi:CPA1 family monovalent cation:H+ antiporter